MRIGYRHLVESGLALLSLSWMISPAFAAKPVNLQNQPAFLQSFSLNPLGQNGIKQLRSDVDFNQTTHIRIQQTYAGYPVWGGDGVVHVARQSNVKTLQAVEHAPTSSHVTMNGTMYQDLNADLQNAPQYIFSPTQADKALQQAIQLYQKKFAKQVAVKKSDSHLIVYIDKDNIAHWAFHVSFMTESGIKMPEKPTFIMDAMTFAVYLQWNNIQTLNFVEGGGFGGNPKMGKLIYDSLTGDYPELEMERDDAAKKCYLENDLVTIKDIRNDYAVSTFSCDTQNTQHNNVYWDADQDNANEGYSPSNDAMYIGLVVQKMFQEWYKMPPLQLNGKAMMLNMIVHVDMENAFWNGEEMYFGDGGYQFYPLVSLGVGAHEISHGFTEQHSNLFYYGQPGALNESFSDMAAQAAEFYSTNHNSWQIGPEIMKESDRALRYMDTPSKDCYGDRPGDYCSVEHINQYYESLDVHYGSGIFNKVFYLIGTAKNWNTKKAFDVMVQANSYYWTSHTSFGEAACGVVKATKDYQYDLQAVTDAMTAVGLDTKDC